MPGIILFRRRWNISSDDFLVPGVLLFLFHFIWIIILSSVLTVGVVSDNPRNITKNESSILSSCRYSLDQLITAHLAIFTISAIMEAAIVVVALRGTIWNAEPRSIMAPIVYARLVMMAVEIMLLVPSLFWVSSCFNASCEHRSRGVLLGVTLSNICVFVTVFLGFYFSFDPAGKYSVQREPLQNLPKENETKFEYSRKITQSGELFRASPSNSWVQRCQTGSKSDSLLKISRFFTPFLSRHDLVPTDIFAGFVLLKKYGNYQASEISDTKSLTEVETPDLTSIAYWMKYVIAGYEWTSHSACKTSCCSASSCCNSPSLSGDIEITYTSTSTREENGTPFFVAVDYEKQKIVISICNINTDMTAIIANSLEEMDLIPLNTHNAEIYANKRTIQNAVAILEKLNKESIIEKSLCHKPERTTQSFQLFTVGHSLAAGTAAILAIMLRERYSAIQGCSFAPPGRSAAELTRSFITTIALSDDVVPRFGAQQLEKLRRDLITAIKQNDQSKWTIVCKQMLRCQATKETAAKQTDANSPILQQEPLVLPGNIIHLVRDYCEIDKFRAVYSNPVEFQRIRVSSQMFRDHGPFVLQHALNKVLSGKDDKTFVKYPDIATPSEQFRVLETPPTPQKKLQQRNILLDLSFTSIENSPALDERVQQRGHVRELSNTSSTDGRNHLIYSRDEDDCHVFANLLVASIATPETLSDASIPSSVQSSVKPSRKLDLKAVADKLSPEASSSSSSRSDTNEITEGSSVYCLSPMSSVRNIRHGGQQRTHLKREILRLYQRAAADVREASPISTKRQLTSIQSETNSGTSTPSSGSPLPSNYDTLPEK